MSDQGKSKTQAADDLNNAVVQILKRLRKGEVVSLPGLGRLVPGPKPTFSFEQKPAAKGGRRGKR